MKKTYMIKLKNGETLKIDDEQYLKISKLLTQNKASMPNFITIGEQIIKTDYIATIKAEAW